MGQSQRYQAAVDGQLSRGRSLGHPEKTFGKWRPEPEHGDLTFLPVRRVFGLPSGGEFPVFCWSHWFQRADPAPGVPDRGGGGRGGLLSAPQRQSRLEANCDAASYGSRADGGEPAVQYLRRAGAVSCVRKTLHGGGAALRRGHCRGVSGDDALVRLLQRGHDQRQVHKPVRESDPGNFIAAGDGAADDPGATAQPNAQAFRSTG